MVEPLKVFDMLKVLSDGKIHPINQFVGSIGATQQDITEAIQVIGHEYGIIIHQPQPNHYQLDAPITWLSEEAVYALLSPKAQSAFTLSFVKALDSTNAQLKALAQKNPSIGLVLASEWQSHGYGKKPEKMAYANWPKLSFFSFVGL